MRGEETLHFTWETKRSAAMRRTRWITHFYFLGVFWLLLSKERSRTILKEGIAGIYGHFPIRMGWTGISEG